MTKYIGNAPSAVALTSDEITDGIISTAKVAADAITEAKLADTAVENEHLNVNVITGQTAETSIATDDTILIHDTSASALRKMTRANFVSGIGGGKINQVLFNDAVINTTTSSDVEIISKAITPSATSSKILIIAAFSCQLNTDEYASFDIYRGSLASGTKILDGSEMMFSAQNNIRLWSSFTMLDSPSTTSATTYTIVGSPLSGGTIQFGASGRQTITLMEVLA